jgi:hypothetical protein
VTTANDGKRQVYSKRASANGLNRSPSIAVYRYLLPPANRFDGKNFFGLLLLNFTVRLASGLCESLQIMEISADRFAEFGKS